MGALSFFLSQCATDLKSDADLGQAPEEFSQKIEMAIVEEPKPLDMEKVEPGKAESGKTETMKSPEPSKAKAEPVVPKAKVTPKEKKASAPKETSKSKSKEAPKSLSQSWPISVGEKIQMTLRWGPIEGGVVTLEVKEPKNIDGVPVLHYSGVVKSSKMLQLFYKIDNTIDSWVRVSDLAPLRQEIKQLESSRWGRRVLLFDPESQEVKFYEHMTKESGEVKEIRKVDTMLEGSQDLFGAFYFYRYVQHLRNGFRYPIHDKSKNWNAELRYIQDETIRVPAGIFETKHYKILPKLEGHLEPKGDIDVWLTDDPRNILVQFKAKINVGSITGEMIEYEEGRPVPFELPVWKTPVTELGK